jgi:alkyl hydroperoxide reductase subunit AhpF
MPNQKVFDTLIIGAGPACNSGTTCSGRAGAT